MFRTVHLLISVIETWTFFKLLIWLAFNRKATQKTPFQEDIYDEEQELEGGNIFGDLESDGGKTAKENDSRSGGKKVPDPKAGHWSTIWWKARGIPAPRPPRSTASPAPLTAGAIRDVNGKLCGIDLHGGFDVPPLNGVGGRTVCKAPVGVSPTDSEIRPLSFERPPSVMSMKPLEKPTPYRLGSLRALSPLPTTLNVSSRIFSDSSSVYSVSTSHEAQVSTVDPHKRPPPELKINTEICSFYAVEYEELVDSGLCPVTPTVERTFSWDKEAVSHRGVICGIDRYGDSIYKDVTPTPYDDESTNSSQTTKRPSMSTLRTLRASTNPSTPGSNVYTEKSFLKPRGPVPVLPPAPSMLEIRSQFLSTLPGDDALSAITSLTTRRLEEDIMSCLEGESSYPYPLPMNLPRQIRCDGENGEDSNQTGNTNREEPVKSSMIESWRSGVSNTEVQPSASITNLSRPTLLQDTRFSRRRSLDDSVSNVGSTIMRSIELQHPGLKRLGNPRRRYERRAAYEGSEAGVLSVRNEEEEEIRGLRAEVEAARSKTLSFQTILQRTSQRFVDSQNQNEELQRQIADMRDHQKLLYDALVASNERQVDTPYLDQNPESGRNTKAVEGVAGMTYKDNIDDIIEENKRLKTQVKSLSRELAGREEEVRLLIEEMGNRRAITRAEERGDLDSRGRPRGALTDKSASRMGARLKWWRRLLLG
ncbi:hypothetical protein TWF281_002960 [Arthrobotrys megalospora]